ncbi:MAG: Ig-like domain-containing protein, partial [Anaerolineales bacterium]
ANGSTVVNGNNTITYTPDPDWNGSDSFDYQVTDTAQGAEIQQSDAATVDITVDPVNDVPIANVDTVGTDEDASVTVSVLSNDTGLGDAPVSVTVTGSAANGAALANPNNTVTYTPDANWNGVDSFVYTVTDDNGDFDTAAVTVTVNSVNDPPTAGNDSASVDEDSSVTFNVLTNDGDVDGTLDETSVAVVSAPSHGTSSPNPDGTIDYTPDADYRGSDSFTYTVDDNDGATSNAATVSMTVNPVDDTPLTNADSYDTDEDVPLTVPVPGVLGNDSGFGDTPITLTMVATPPPSEGSVALSDDGSFTFAPAANFNGTTSFGYTITDSGLLSGENADTSGLATVTITVYPVNDPPLAANDPQSPTVYQVDEDDPAGLTVAAPGVLGNDTDVDNIVPDDLSAVLDSDPSNGTVTLSPDGSFEYHPDRDFNGTDSFTYLANDGTDDSSSPATVNLIVNPTNDLPNAVDDNFGSIDQGATVTDSVSSNDSDPDAGDSVDPSSVTITSGPAHGTSVPNVDGTVTYTHDGGADLSDSFVYRICDSAPSPLCDTATVDITIRRPQLTIDLSPDSDSVGPNSDVTFTASFWNDGPGTAYDTVVTAAVGGGCTLRTANPIFSGNLADAAAAFEDVTVRSGSDGSSCSVSVSINSTNGTSGSDESTLSVPSGGAGLLSFLSEVFGGGSAASATPTATLVPTSSPTLVASEAATEMPSSTPTPAQSASPTLAVPATGTATALPTATQGASATPQSTASPAPTATPEPVVPTSTPEVVVPTPTPEPAVFNYGWMAASAPIEVATGSQRIHGWDAFGWLHWLFAWMGE